MTNERDRVVAGQPRDEDVVDRAVRPRTLVDYQGQTAVKAQMGLFIEAARRRSEALDHVLIFGPQALARRHSPISWPTNLALA